MTLIYEIPPRAADVRRPVKRPIQGPGRGRETRGREIGGHESLARSRRPGPARPAGSPMRYHGSAVAMSVAPHRSRPVTVATTVGLALLAGIITLWLGLVADFGQMANGDSSSASSASSAAHVPDRLAVVRVAAGETLQDVAARVAPDAPVRQVSERIRELNALNSPALVAGQTLIAPVG
jgi:LysM domain